MYNFILQIIIMISLGAMIYLIARAAPRVGDSEESFEKFSYTNRLDQLIAKIPFDEVDAALSVSVEKLLRKLKLFLLKWDNLLSEHIKKIKKINDNNGFKKEEKQNLFNSDNQLEDNIDNN
ncbi:MAG: hypothetical protein AAB366_02435 [Patescibacteria group bacterium]